MACEGSLVLVARQPRDLEICPIECNVKERAAASHFCLLDTESVSSRRRSRLLIFAQTSLYVLRDLID